MKKAYSFVVYMHVYFCTFLHEQHKMKIELLVTGSQSPSSLWLILVNPVVKMFPSLVKMALIGRMPSCGARRSCWSAQGKTRATSLFTFLTF